MKKVCVFCKKRIFFWQTSYWRKGVGHPRCEMLAALESREEYLTRLFGLPTSDPTPSPTSSPSPSMMPEEDGMLKADWAADAIDKEEEVSTKPDNLLYIGIRKNLKRQEV